MELQDQANFFLGWYQPTTLYLWRLKRLEGAGVEPRTLALQPAALPHGRPTLQAFESLWTRYFWTTTAEWTSSTWRAGARSTWRPKTAASRSARRSSTRTRSSTARAKLDGPGSNPATCIELDRPIFEPRTLYDTVTQVGSTSPHPVITVKMHWTFGI